MKKRSKIILYIVLCTVFCVSLGNIAYTYVQDTNAQKSYDVLQEYIQFSDTETTSSDDTTDMTDETDQSVPEQIVQKETAPIEVDFEELCGKYKDVVGWLYTMTKDFPSPNV